MRIAGWSVLALAVVGCTPKMPFEPGGPPFPPFEFDGGIAPVGPQPQFAATVTATTPPVPLSGGTLRVLADGKTAVAADPDRDQVYIVNLAAATLTATVALAAGDEPGRVIADGAGRVHVVARGGGALVTIDPAAGTVIARRAVCPAPRGAAYEAATDLVHVACAGGELVSLPAAGGAATRTVQLDLDLRDVEVGGGYLWVTRFRTAELLLVDGTGALAKRWTLPMLFDSFNQPFAPAVAWRLQPLANGRMALVHQAGLVGSVPVTQGGYGGGGMAPTGCGGIVESAIAVLDPQLGLISDQPVRQAVLPVDFAASSPSLNALAVVSAGNSHTPELPQVVVVPLSVVVPPPGAGAPDGGAVGAPGPNGGCIAGLPVMLGGEVTSLAFDAGDQLWVQTREPARLVSTKTNQAITLSSQSRADTGWAIFHSNSGAELACASCHPEGGEDGRTWDFAGIGQRRTQMLRGHIGGTEPFHWSGDLPDFDALVGEVYLKRMSGPSLASDQKTALFGWIDSIPTLPHSPPADPAAVARGQALFSDAKNVGCVTCHSGPQLSNNATVDVGTGGAFQVPRLLNLAWRAPFLHDGCAATLADRFGPCGGGDAHGSTSHLTAAQQADLIAYLQTL